MNTKMNGRFFGKRSQRFYVNKIWEMKIKLRSELGIFSEPNTSIKQYNINYKIYVPTVISHCSINGEESYGYLKQLLSDSFILFTTLQCDIEHRKQLHILR